MASQMKQTFQQGQNPRAYMPRDVRFMDSRSLQNENEINIACLGQQTVQEIVHEATCVFKQLRDSGTSSNTQQCQVALNRLKELFARLRVLYDECNKRIESKGAADLEKMIPVLNTNNQPNHTVESSQADGALIMERNELVHKLEDKNEHIKMLIEQLRVLVWDVNTMMSLKSNR